MTTIPPIVRDSAQHDEDVARGDIYSLLAHLFFASPTPELLEQLRAAPDAPAGSNLAPSWDALIACAQGLSLSAIQAEYDALFGGVGRPNVYLFGSHYLAGFLNEKPLVRLRDDLAALGLERDRDMRETEDHVAYLCEVMRYLIANSLEGRSTLVQQRDFYVTHIRPWVDALCDAIVRQPTAVFYAKVAELFRDFNGIESQSFDMLT